MKIFDILRISRKWIFRSEYRCGGRARSRNCRALRASNFLKITGENANAWILIGEIFREDVSHVAHNSQRWKNMKVLEKFQIYLLPTKICKQDWMIYALWVRTKIHNALSWLIIYFLNIIYIINSIRCFK